MAIVKIRNQALNIDIAEELEDFDFGYNADWRADKLIARSPFRDDNRPSFYVHLDGDSAGTWGDSGSGQKGGLLALLAELRGECEAEVADYLTAKYGAPTKPGEPIRINAPKLRTRQTHKTPEPVTQAVSPYLKTRGISDEVQRTYAVGYGEDKPGFTAIPWHTPDGRLANIKYRSTRGKDFFYAKGATPIADLVYGLDVINERGETEAVLCEGEIDVLSWRTAGIPAIAVGSASISPAQVDAIKRSSLRVLALGGDNDAAGRRLNERAETALQSHLRICEVDYGDYNDANEVLIAMGSEGLRNLSNFTVFKLTESTIQLRNISVK
ncbi:toprim domain-containing protein [Sporosarcina koreensis]|uniref:toprim domain-containing protein n=1 Tax=Sporosarcina koreensis TaxID=334735 RepID=UPI0007595202|nr:toprim domain-containing protein [Sporosarcina koreensis]